MGRPNNWFADGGEGDTDSIRPLSKRALPLVSVGLEKYCQIQADLAKTDVSRDRGFQTRFNSFYRVRRNADWQYGFYTLLEQQKAAP